MTRRRPSAVPARTEHNEQADLISWAAKARAMYALAPDLSALDMLFAIPNAGGFSGGFKANAVRVARLKREGVRSGVPDLMLAVPVGQHPGLFIEMKRERDSRASAEQRAFITNLRTVGYLAVVCNGFDEARAVLETYLRPVRQHGAAAVPAFQQREPAAA